MTLQSPWLPLPEKCFTVALKMIMSTMEFRKCKGEVTTTMPAEVMLKGRYSPEKYNSNIIVCALNIHIVAVRVVITLFLEYV